MTNRCEARIQALTLDQINAAFRKYLDPAGVTIVKAGDFKKAGRISVAEAVQSGRRKADRSCHGILK
jgi:zinc protease